MTVPTELITASQNLSPEETWLELLDIRVSDSETIYVSRNNETVTFDGHDYLPFPFTVSAQEQNADGNAGEVTITCDNNTGIFTAMLERGLSRNNCEITYRLGVDTYLADPTKWASSTFAVTDVTCNDQAVSFRLSASPIFDMLVPSRRAERSSCFNTYRSATGCKYAAQVATVAGATNASPIVITTAAAHGFKDGASAVVASVGGNTAANGTWEINVTGALTFELVGSVGSGAYTSGGTATVDLPSCDFTLDGANGCIAHNNFRNFGGFSCMRRGT